MYKYRDRIYKHYVNVWNEKEAPHSLADLAGRGPSMRFLINSFFPREKTSSILDLGCGHGALIYYAKLEGFFNIRGIDVSEQQVALAHELGITDVSSGNLIEALELSLQSSLDVVVTFDVIEHFTKDELVNIVDLIQLALKPGGRWIIHAPNGISPFGGAVRFGDFTHVQSFTPSSLQQLLCASGFGLCEFAESGPRVHGLRSAIRVVLWQGIRLLYKLILAAETGSFKIGQILTQNFYTVTYKAKSHIHAK